MGAQVKLRVGELGAVGVRFEVEIDRRPRFSYFER